MTPAAYSEDERPLESPLAAYRELASGQARNYDRRQDISPRQMVLLLELSERTGANLGQALAAGEQESAHTWNDYVRPTLRSGKLGAAAGVWQFQPATFQAIIKRYGNQLLDGAAADAESGRRCLDLGDGPFTDTQVRGIIRATVEGQRDSDNEGLALLHHNFAVLAFAKHYLSVDTGASTPEEDYLFHFLGAGRGKRVLALARGEARDTLSVKPVEVPVTALDAEQARVAGEMTITVLASEIDVDTLFPPATALLDFEPVIQALPPPVSSERGFSADSRVVTGNLGMFYPDGNGESEPYTWAQFMDHLARRVRAKSQPALVRAKYGVGFTLNGGDIPGTAFDSEKDSDPVEFRYRSGRTVLVPEAMVTGPLDRDEAERYIQRLAALVSQGDDEPVDTLPPESLSALHHLGVLPLSVEDASTTVAKVREALHAFREKVGKATHDDTAQEHFLTPAERVALEACDRRVAHYASLQGCQLASFDNAPDLNRVKTLPAGAQCAAAVHVAAVKRALLAQGLLKQPTKKHVWRDKKRKKRVSYKTIPFAGKPGKATLAALDGFQVRNGLLRTGGALDAVTLEMLGLLPMGPEIFRPLSGPHCTLDPETEVAAMCEVCFVRRRIGATFGS